jgi:hypothetical protein
MNIQRSRGFAVCVLAPRLVCFVAGAGVSLLWIVGCAQKTGLPTAPVVGKVTYRGKPVPTGTVMFTPEEGPAATGNIAPDGTYRLTTYREADGAVIGRHKVTITALQDMGNLLPEQRSPTPPPLVPVKYLSAETSGLTAEVKPGVTNTIDFTLTD